MAKKTKNEKLDLNEMAIEIQKQAEQRGLNENYFFQTTFERYKTQLHIMDELKLTIEMEGTLVQKEYVKGRPNVTINPAITEYNKTATAANGTVSTLVKILTSFNGVEASEPADAMMDFLNS